MNHDEKDVAALYQLWNDREADYTVKGGTLIDLLLDLEKLYKNFNASEALARAMNDDLTTVWPVELDDLNQTLDEILSEPPEESP